MFWLAFYLFIKGGYAVGFAGGPNPSILRYDFINIIVRLFLLTSFIHLPIWGGKWLTKTVALILSLFIIVIKIQFFTFPIINLR